MLLLLDQGLPRTAVHHLATLGIAAEHIGDLGMSAATDEAILAAGRQRSAVVVTMDADFHRSLAFTGEIAPSVIRIRVEGLKGDQLATLIAQVIQTAKSDLAVGAVLSVTETRVRIRRLPIVRI